MCCFTNSKGLITIAVVLCSLCAWSGTPAQDQPAEGRSLDIIAHEYSRFEISKDDVVAFYTGGVEFDYLGYHLRANELRYNHSSQEAVATGNVAVTLDGFTAYTERIQINGTLGTVEILQPLTGIVEEPPIGFEAGACKAEFPPNSSNVTLDDLKLEFSQGVTITAEQQSSLACEGLKYDGRTKQVHSVGPVVLHANYGVRELNNGAQLDLSELVVNAAALTATIDADGTIRNAELSEIAISANGATLLAQAAIMTNLQPDVPGLGSWSAELSGAPILGSLKQDEQQLDFQAGRLTVSASTTELQRLRLADAVEIVYAGSQLAGDVVEVELRADGYAISMPDGVNAAFDLSRYSGTDNALTVGALTP